MVLKTVAAGIGIVIAVVVGVLVLFGFMAVFGGLTGAAIALSYNVLLGASVDVTFWAMVGSFLSVFSVGQVVNASTEE